MSDTVGGRHPAAVDRYFIPLFSGFYIPGGCLGFLPPPVLSDVDAVDPVDYR